MGTLSSDRGSTVSSVLGVESSCGAALTLREVEGTKFWELCVGRFEEEAGAREWSFAKIAVDVGADTGPIDMRGVGTAVVSEEGAEVPFRNGAEAAV